MLLFTFMPSGCMSLILVAQVLPSFAVITGLVTVVCNADLKSPGKVWHVRTQQTFWTS